MAVIDNRCLLTESIRNNSCKKVNMSATWKKTLLCLIVYAWMASILGAATPHSNDGNIGGGGGGSGPNANGNGQHSCDIADSDALRDYDLAGMLPTQGSICGANSCCASVETKIRQTTRNDVEKFYKDSVAQVSSLFETRARRLEELFRDMMNKSKKELHNMFYRTYGMIYMQNAHVFTDFFVELEKYYAQGGIRLAETMDRFFTILYQRMFVVINAQYDFNEDYLACVAKDIADLKPFGDIPNKLAGMLRRAFVATRTFHRSLGKGAQVVEKMMRLNISDVCGEDVMKMQHCDVCTGNRGPGACNQYCSDTIRKCFGDLSELNEKWNIYIEGLDKVADKLLGPFNIEVVVEPINVKISEAIMNFQDSGTEVSQKVFQKCGQPKLKGDRMRRAAKTNTSESKEIKSQSLRFNKNKKKHKKTNDYDRQSLMEKRIVEVKGKIKDTRSFWDNLRYQYCNNITTASPDESNCWNGYTLTGYPATQQNKLTKNSLVYEQTYTLGVLISHLESAYMGQDVDETDDDDEDEALVQSGSGSGDDDIDDDDTHVDEEIEVEVSGTTTSTSTTTTTTSTTTTTESNDVEIVKEYEGDGEEPSVVQASSATELTKALAHYILPIVMVWLGGAVTELL